MKGNEKLYIQVSDDISGEETFRREVDHCCRFVMRIPRYSLQEPVTE